MLATPPLTPMDTLPTLTPMVATPMLMVPDMAHTPTWDKMFTTPSIQSIHTELKLSVMARGLLMLSQKLMLPSCMELMAMLPPTPMDTLATPDTLPTRKSNDTVEIAKAWPFYGPNMGPTWST